MRSNEARPRLLRSVLAWLVAAAGLGAAFRMRGPLAEQFHRLEVTGDVYALPPPDQLIVASLGYRAALADLVFAHVLVSYGLHFQEDRRFEFVGEYLEAVNALDPQFRDPYKYADTLIVMSPEPPRQQDYEKARAILERGLRERPYDTELWLQTGQYLAYLAWPHLDGAEAKAAWRQRGAEVMARACELASANENVPYHCIAAARIFERAGQREAAIESLRRLLLVNDDPEIERRAMRYLSKHLLDREREKYDERKQAFERLWKQDLGFVSKDAFLVLGPPVDLARCAGRAWDAECETTWAAWTARVDSTPGREGDD